MAFRKNLTKKIGILLILILAIFIKSTPQIIHKNKGESISKGEYHSGSMVNGYLLPRKGVNFKCYSFISYYLLAREYTNSKIHRTVTESYKELNIKYPEKTFIYMESARRKGGRLFPHRTHQNGLSVDFMSPLVKHKSKPKYFNGMGIFRYALNFDENGKLNSNKNIAIDFNAIADHILILEKNARKNGLKIKKVIFKINLKDDLFNTESGKKLKNSGIYFAQNLTPQLNKLHDDHYHVDFELRK